MEKTAPSARPSPTESPIPPVAFQDLRPDLRDLLAPRYERLGYLGEFFGRAAHQPDALLHFARFTDAGKDALGARLTEVVALTASVALGNDYERNQHERLSVRQGQSPEWVRDIQRLAPDEATEIDDDDRAAQRVALALLGNHGHDSRDVVEAYADAYGAAAAMALLLVVSRYAAHAVVANALEFQPPVPSIFAAEQK